MRAASEAELGGGDTWRLYDYVARHFLASVSPDAVYKKTKATLTAGGGGCGSPRCCGAAAAAVVMVGGGGRGGGCSRAG
jgi:hypothetical protein